MAGFALVGSTLLGETTPSAPVAASAESQNPTADKSRLVRLLAAEFKAAASTGLPGYEQARIAVSENADWTDPAKASLGDGEVLVLPNFVVQDARPPKPEEVLSMAGKLDHYLGSKDGLDRGRLNRFVLNWGSGFVGVSLFGATKNETRVKTMYRDEQRLRNREELLDLSSLLKETGDKAGSELARRTSDDLFFRKIPFERK